ncbi:tyrosine-type recombinase/integrase [Oceanobacillus jeddahense]|uniref:tyrosine-type recombinase/integrase n=1 Tax=Oceanobacillus jeddahense TaxID=1462527 RepID=UPI000596058C|nr:site-specific integrase [Oceanobacillus jeddahense]
MRNPNGYGGVVNLGKNRRKPYAARITTGYHQNGTQKYAYLGYYKTSPEAYKALADYNETPYDIDMQKVTFEQLYYMFYKDKFGKTAENESKANKYCYQQGFNHSEPIHNEKFINLKKPKLQSTIDNCKKGDSTKANMLKLYNQMFKFAMENDIVNKNYAQFVKIRKEGNQKNRVPFSDEEISTLWKNVDDHDYVDTILILIYTGLRISELLNVKNENVHLDKRYFIGGSKTESGKDRLIPIHKKILPLIEDRFDQSKKYLIMENSKKVSYQTYRHRWDGLMEVLNMEHLPHDTRHTFASLMDELDVNRTSVKRILGHATGDITEKTYTHKNIKQLIDTIDKLVI